MCLLLLNEFGKLSVRPEFLSSDVQCVTHCVTHIGFPIFLRVHGRTPRLLHVLHFRVLH